MIDWVVSNHTHEAGLQWGTVAQWASVIATLGAIVVALFGERIRALLWRPRTSVRVGLSPTLCVATYATNDHAVRLTQGVFEWYIRAAVTNVGVSEIRDCEVVCEELWRYESGQWHRVDEVLPIALKWSFSHQEGKTQGRLQSIPSGATRYLDICHITLPSARVHNPDANKRAVDPISGVDAPAVEWELDYTWSRANREAWHIQPWGEYRMLIRTIGIGVSPQDFWVLLKIPNRFEKDANLVSSWLSVSSTTRPRT